MEDGTYICLFVLNLYMKLVLPNHSWYVRTAVITRFDQFHNF